MSCLVLSYLILSDLILPYPIVSYLILSSLNLSCLILSFLSCLGLAWLNLSHIISSHLISSHRIASHLILSCLFEMTKVNLKYNVLRSKLHALAFSFNFSLGIRDNSCSTHIMDPYPFEDTRSHRCTPSAMVHGSTRPFSSLTSRVVVSQGSARQGLFTFLKEKWCSSLLKGLISSVFS